MGKDLTSKEKRFINLEEKNLLKPIKSVDSYDIEKEIVESSIPIDLTDETAEEVTCLNQRGVWLNKRQCIEWSNKHGSISRYKLNDSKVVDIIHKRNNSTIQYNQKVHVRYLKPPSPPPAELIIRSECDESINTMKPPPMVIRQMAVRPSTPTIPLILREGKKALFIKRVRLYQ